jgi:hypothetical protein
MPPRFHLRFDPEEGTLELAHPLVVGPFTLAELRLGLGPMEGPVDLRAGAESLQHRRTRVVAARVAVDTAELAERGVRMNPEDVQVQGADLLVPATESLGRSLRGLELVRTVSTPPMLRIVRPLGVLLIEALVPWGWRAPDDELVQLRLASNGAGWHVSAEEAS